MRGSSHNQTDKVKADVEGLASGTSKRTPAPGRTPHQHGFDACREMVRPLRSGSSIQSTVSSTSIKMRQKTIVATVGEFTDARQHEENSNFGKEKIQCQFEGAGLLNTEKSVR